MCEYGESNSSLILGKDTRYHYAILAENCCGPNAGLGVGVDLLDQHLFGGGADDLFLHRAAFEDD